MADFNTYETLAEGHFKCLALSWPNTGFRCDLPFGDQLTFSSTNWSFATTARGARSLDPSLSSSQLNFTYLYMAFADCFMDSLLWNLSMGRARPASLRRSGEGYLLARAFNCYKSPGKDHRMIMDRRGQTWPESRFSGPSLFIPFGPMLGTLDAGSQPGRACSRRQEGFSSSSVRRPGLKGGFECLRPGSASSQSHASPALPCVLPLGPPCILPRPNMPAHRLVFPLWCTQPANRSLSPLFLSRLPASVMQCMFVCGRVGDMQYANGLIWRGSHCI